MKYKTSLDNLAKVISIGITVLFAIIIIGQYSIIKGDARLISIYITVALLVFYFIAYALRPTYYSITKEKIIIHRLITDVQIVRKEIKSVEIIDKEKLSWSIRTFGVGGLFGYFGKFYNSKIGKMTWYATRRDKAVLLVTFDNKNIILTPDDANGFVSNLDL